MKLKINLPQSWSEISLATFDKICHIPADTKDYSREVLKTVLNLTDQEVDLIPMIDYLDLINRLSWMNEYPPVNKIPKNKIVLNGKSYNVLLFPNRMTAAQFIDYRFILINDDSKLKQAKLLSVFIVPEGCKYNDGTYDFDEVSQIVNDYLNIEYALGLSYFFVMVSAVFLQASLECSAQEMKHLMKGEKDKTIKENLRKTLRGMKQIKNDLKETLTKKNQKLKDLMRPIGRR